MQLEQIKNSIFVSNIIKMKRVVSLLIVLLALNSCDDGDLIQEDISFEDVTRHATIVYNYHRSTRPVVEEVIDNPF